MVNQSEYLKWYRIAEPLLGKLVPPLTDQQVSTFVSPQGWLIFPTATESNLEAVKRRPSPTLYFSVNGKIDVGLTCYNSRSVDKMKKVLTSSSSTDKQEFLKWLRRLDHMFETSIGQRTQEGHHRRPWVPRELYGFTSNTVTDSLIHELFKKSDRVIERGRKLRETKSKFKRLLSYITLAEASVPKVEQTFASAITSLVPPYELSLTASAPGPTRSPAIVRLLCPKGHHSWPTQLGIRCPECKTLGVPE